MSRCLLFAVLAGWFWVPAPSLAQVRGGVHGGASVFRVLSNYDGTIRADASPTMGVWLGSSLWGSLALRVEAHLTRRGHRVGKDRAVRIDITEIPVLLTYDLRRSEVDAAYLSAGVVAALERQCRHTTVERGPPGIPDVALETTCDGSAPIDPVITDDRELGIAFGVGSEVRLGRPVITFDARMVIGVTRQLAYLEQRSTQLGPRQVESAGRSVGFQILVGFALP